MIWDMDDWMYIRPTRCPWPVFGAWNPTRIFPEVFMPLTTGFAAYFIYPLTGDYLGSATIMFAAVISLFILLYLYMFKRLMRNRFELNEGQAVLCSGLFLVLHFLIFVVSIENNAHAFYALDAACYFYYIIPTLLNATAVMYWESMRGLAKKNEASKWAKILTPAVIYFGIFSNLYSSYVLAIYAGLRLLEALVTAISKREKAGRIVIANVQWVAIIAMWMFSAVYEVLGDRARNIASSESKGSFIQAAEYFISRFRDTNIVFRAFVAGCILLAAIMVIWFAVKKTHRENMIGYCGFFMLMATDVLLSAMYIIILSSKVDVWYAQRSDVCLGLVFVALLAVMAAVCLILKYFRINTEGFFLLAAVIMLLAVNRDGNTFKEPTVGGCEPEVCSAVTNDIIEQVLAAERQGLDAVEIRVPAFDGESNWPLAEFGKNRITYALYEHGVVGRKLESTVVVDESMNIKYGIY